MDIRTVAAAIDPGAASTGRDAGDAEDDGGTEGAAPTGRLVVVADASFLDPQFTGSNQQNQVFAANAIDWLAQDEALIRIRSKNRTPPALAFTSDAKKNLMKWGNLAGVPLLFVAYGAFRITGRKHRAEARWKEVIS
jgi:ABC-type uncharacterized transport system involved in gliding motility auxiliary subunit